MRKEKIVSHKREKKARKSRNIQICTTSPKQQHSYLSCRTHIHVGPPSVSAQLKVENISARSSKSEQYQFPLL